MQVCVVENTITESKKRTSTTKRKDWSFPAMNVVYICLSVVNRENGM